MLRSPLIAAILFVAAVPALAKSPVPVRETFEAVTFAGSFVPCERPEGLISLSQDRARDGNQALKLVIPEPVFSTATWVPKATSCLIAGRYAEYTPDEKERAEIWESFDFGPAFGDDLYYGFAMWIDRCSAPQGDDTRLVIGQRKAPIDDSPFIAQRFTGGYFHVTLDVDSDRTDPATGRPYGCKLVLAFERALAEKQSLTLQSAPACEARQDAPTDLQPAKAIAIQRLDFLPSPFDHWVDLVYHVKGGPNGIVELWADGRKVARATGYVGHQGAVGQPQYFKFGPYRDKASFATTVYLDNLARGDSFAAVDPSMP